MDMGIILKRMSNMCCEGLKGVVMRIILKWVSNMGCAILNGCEMASE